MATAVKNIKLFNKKVTITVQNIIEDIESIHTIDDPGVYKLNRDIYNKYMKMQTKSNSPPKWQFNKIG